MRNRVWLHSCRLCISLTFLSIQSTAFEGTFEIKSILILFRENGGARRVSLKADIQSCFPSVKIKFKDSGARYGSRKTLSVHWDWTRRQVGIVERNIWRLQLERIIKLWIGLWMKLFRLMLIHENDRIKLLSLCYLSFIISN